MSPLQYTLSRDEQDRTAGIMFLIIRSGAKDSLNWWEDESLTEAGGFALAKLFPRDSHRVAVRLAFEAARQRHNALLDAAGTPRAITLFDITENIINLMSTKRRSSYQPVTSLEEFRHGLIDIAPEIKEFILPEPNARGLLDLTEMATPDGQSISGIVTLLASGYLRSQPGKLVVPFVQTTKKDRL